MTKRKTSVKPSENRTESGKFAPGKSGNPGGRPKKSESVTAWFREFQSLTGAEVAARCELYAREFRKAGDELPLAAVIAARVILAIVNEPDARLLAQFLDRTEGKVVQPTADLTALVAAELARRGLTPAQAVAADPLMADLFAAVGLPVSEVGG